jgi:hypothetical protein
MSGSQIVQKEGKSMVDTGTPSLWVPTSAKFLRELVGIRSSSALSSGSDEETPTNSPRTARAEIAFDSIDDTRYARGDAAFNKVVHIFHKHWHGIRTAAGVLPGHKVAIRSPDSISASSIFALRSQLDDWEITKAVFHGFSHAADRALRAVLHAGIESFLVWHGNLSQLVWEPEVQFFEMAHTACQRGYFRRAHMIKSGMDAVFPRSFVPMLLNSPPITGRGRVIPAFASGRKVALVPAHTDIRKNLHSSLLGAALADRIDDVLFYGKIRSVIPVTKRCKRIKYRDHDHHIALLHEIDVTVNVTTIDCHPMVDLEALGAGGVSLSGPLFLDALQTHPYTALSVIENPFSVNDIRDRLVRLCQMNNSELNEIIADYTAALSKISLERYKTFLEI